MKKVIVHLLDVNDLDFSSISSSIYIKESDVEDSQKYSFLLDQKEHLASSYFKNRYVGDYHYNDNGKPISDKYFFNISHSHGVVVFVMDEHYSVGIDIEKVKPVEEDFKKFVCSDEEYKELKSEKDFYKIWTNKESLVKCCGTGINQKPENIPGIPLNSKRIYQHKIYQSRILEYNGYIISVSLESAEEFEISIIKEKL